jgi:hypothetical protein
MITREAFVLAIQKIRTQEANIKDFSDALSKLSDGITTFDIDNQYLSALRDVLGEAMHDKNDWLGWWLYEAADYTVSWEEDGKEISVNLEDVNALYDFLVNNAATITDEQLPISDMPSENGETHIFPRKTIELCDFSNCFESVINYIERNDVALHIIKDGKPQYVLLNMKCWNEMEAGIAKVSDGALTGDVTAMETEVPK